MRPRMQFGYLINSREQTPLFIRRPSVNRVSITHALVEAHVVCHFPARQPKLIALLPSVESCLGGKLEYLAPLAREDRNLSHKCSRLGSKTARWNALCTWQNAS
ncbi:hypothetical protein HN011_012196 [Eciton burchellii]|nr:hypothetical protein HN011_012196 [Eciton burchellii]